MQYQTSLFRGQPDTYAIQMIREYEPIALSRDPRGYCVCTSEGKDSRVLGHLMRRAGVRHFYLHNITGIDPTELVYFQRRNFAEYESMGHATYDIRYPPGQSMWDLMVKKRVPPIRTMRYCCEHLKERKHPSQGRAVMSLGVRKHESVRRMAARSEIEVQAAKRHRIKLTYDNGDTRRAVETCSPRAEIRINPIADWTDGMLWDYIHDARLEQCSLYSEGFERLGCIGCPMAGEHGRRREFDRWPRFEALYRWAFRRMWQGRVDAGLPLFKCGATPDEWFDWWMSDRGQEQIDADQLTMEGMM